MSTIPFWRPAVALTPVEERLLGRCKKQPIFNFLRAIRHELFDDAFQRELARMYGRGTKGRPPAPPALLAMATLLQAARGLSDQDAVLAAETDRTWQLVLGTLSDDRDEGPFGQTTLFQFRLRLIAHDMDRRLVERTIELATRSGLFSPRSLRAAFDASPLRGSGMSDDNYWLSRTSCGGGPSGAHGMRRGRGDAVLRRAQFASRGAAHRRFHTTCGGARLAWPRTGRVRDHVAPSAHAFA